MLKIRLRRMGSRHRPFYRVVVSDSRRVPTSSALEEIGVYDPRQRPSRIDLKLDRVDHWLERGARPSDTVKKIVAKARRQPDEPVDEKPVVDEKPADEKPEQAESTETAAAEETAEASDEQVAADAAAETAADEASDDEASGDETSDDTAAEDDASDDAASDDASDDQKAES